MFTGRLTRRGLLSGAAAVAAVTVGPASLLTTRAQEASWEPLVTDGSGPPARWDHVLAADEAGQRLFVFGGRDASRVAMNDTWVFDLASGAWSPVEGESPSPRFGPATAIDSGKGRLYLFGGEDNGTFYNDTWRFSFQSGRWQLIDDGTAIAPSPRYGLGGAMDAAGRFIVSHGFTFEGRFDDTWAYDFSTDQWADISPAPETRPLKRCLHEMVRDTGGDRILLYGGCSSGFGPCPQGDLWSFDSNTGVWTNITPAASPSARSNPALVWDDAGQRSILFGGLSESGFVGDLWQGTMDGEAFVWSEMAAGNGPTARASHDAVVLGNAVYVFGGTSAEGTFNDLWRLTL